MEGQLGQTVECQAAHSRRALCGQTEAEAVSEEGREFELKELDQSRVGAVASNE